MAQKEYRVDFLPKCIYFTIYKGSIWANIELDNTPTVDDLMKCMTWLQAYRFEYSDCTHTLGYYDSVDNKTLEFSLMKASKSLIKVLQTSPPEVVKVR